MKTRRMPFLFFHFSGIFAGKAEKGAKKAGNEVVFSRKRAIVTLFFSFD
jgi:hypothetical protein